MSVQQTELFDLEKFVIRNPKPVDTPVTHEVREGRYQIKSTSTISAAALDEIKNLMRSRLVETRTWGVEEISEKELNGLIDEMGNEWSTRQGNWPKRFAKVIKHRRGQKLNSDFLSVVGKIARESCVMDTGRDLIITRKFDWEPGTYGDEESCFWGCREGAKIILQDNGGMALLIHGAEDEPLARAWCVPYEGNYVVFNCYTVDECPITIVTFARALSDLFNFVYYRNIGLTCRGINCGPLWINHNDNADDWEGGRAYIIGQQDVASMESLDLDYDPLYCDNCESECDSEAHLDENGNVLCGYCEEAHHHCVSCGRRVHDDDVNWISDEALCSRCFDREAFTCYECDYNFYKDDGVTEINGQMHCDDCVDRYFEKCSSCGKLVRKGDICEIDGNDKGYCESCWEEHTFECKQCGERFDSRDEPEGFTSDMCDNCFNRRCSEEEENSESAV